MTTTYHKRPKILARRTHKSLKGQIRDIKSARTAPSSEATHKRPKKTHKRPKKTHKRPKILARRTRIALKGVNIIAYNAQTKHVHNLGQPHVGWVLQISSHLDTCTG